LPSTFAAYIFVAYVLLPTFAANICRIHLPHIFAAYIREIRLHFEQAPIFYACANILSKHLYFSDFAISFCFILLLQIFVYIFSIYLCIFMCANIFGAIVLKPRFKIDIVIDM
jgi:hypothetical protein